MGEWLKAIYRGKPVFSLQGEEEPAAKALSREYDHIYEKLSHTLSPKQAELLDSLLDKESEIEAALDESRYIRYAVFGAQLYQELTGDVSKNDGPLSACPPAGERQCPESPQGRVAQVCKTIEQMRDESLQKGIAAGKKEGRAEGIREMALRMLKEERYPLEEVARLSGLPLEEIKRLGRH